jgi:hypothetical protein
MALDAQYFVTSDLDTYFVDKDSGLPLAGGFLTFYRDVARNTPKTVYQLTGAPPNYSYVALPNPVQLSSVGTVQDSGGDNVVIYYFPYDDEGNLDLYYVTCTDSMGVPQFTREAWPNVGGGSTPIGASGIVQNQIANPQFSQVFINDNQSTVYTVSGASNQVFAFAPDWDFVISGTGSVTVQQIPISGNQNIVTSPPYVLDVALSPGITVCNLRQRFNVNSGLWASTATESIFLSGTLIAENQNSGSSGIQMFYDASSGGSPIIIVDASFDNSGYQLIMDGTTEALPLSTDTNIGDNGYVDIYLSFLLNSHVRISSIQVAPVTNPIGITLLSYDNNSSNREQAYMGDYYIPRLNSRPAASLLTAWDFPLNPFQFAASGNLTNSAAYICDQTIGFAGSSGNVAFSQDTVTNGLALTTAGSNDAFYLMQYLSGPQAQKLLGTPLSVNVFGYVTSMSNAVTMSVYLFRGSSSATIPTLPTSIGTLATNGVFTLTAADWDEIPQSGLPTSQATLPTVSTDSDINNLDNDMGFTGWQIVDNTDISDTQYFAIVVTFAYIDTDTDITINSISLIQSDIPARPAPKSLSEVLIDCQYYYEKSYDIAAYAGAITNNGILYKIMVATLAGGVYGAVPLNFSIIYNTRKRIPINPTVYAKDGTVGDVFVQVFHATSLANSGDSAITAWTQTCSGETQALFQPVDLSSAILGPSGGQYTASANAGIYFHFVADARLGIV